jgi:hypothetical protein
MTETKQTSIDVRKPRKIDGEWLVPVYVNGSSSEAKTYHADDRADAYGTYKALKQWADDLNAAAAAQAEGERQFAAFERMGRDLKRQEGL